MQLETYSQDIVDTVREPLLMLDSTLRVHSANRAFYQTFKVSPEETVHHLIYELGNGQWDIPDLRRLLEDVVPKSSVFNDFELVHTFPAIGRRVMLLNARKLKAGNHGELLVLAMEDVTERRHAEEVVSRAAADLEEIETFSQNIVDTVREPLLMLDTTLRVHSANRAFYQTFQVSPEETENRLIYELGNGQWDIPALRTLLEDVVPQSSVFNDFELEHTFPVIGQRVMLLNARQLKAGNHGELLVLAMEDVTERRRAEEALLQAGALQNAIFNSANFSSIATDAKGVIQIFNVGAERMLGYTADEVMNKITPADISDPLEVIARAKALSVELETPITPGFEALVFKASRGIEDIYELTYIRKDGTRFPAVVSVTALRDAQDAIIGYLLIGTELKAGALQSAIFNSANFSSIATDAKGVIQIFNVGAERMLGYTAAEVMNKITPADISDPQEVVARAATLSQEFATPITPGFEALVFKASRGIEDIYELTYIRKDGSRFPAVVSVTALRDASDTIIGYLLIGTDNTARKQAEQALLQAGALQSAIFNSANFSSIATDAKGVIQIFNVGAERMLGYTADEVMNKITPADISDPQEVIVRAATLSQELGTPITPGFEALVFKAARGIEDIYELTYIRKDGSRFPAVVSVTALRDEQEAIIGYLLIGTDNTARMQVEEEQKKLDQRLRDQQFYTRSLIESNIDALMTTDPRGIITDANKQMEALTGCTRDELIGAPFKNYFTDPDRAEAGIKLVLSEKKVTDYELTVRSREGKETTVSYNATTFYDRDRKLQGVFAAARDVTERKRFEQSLQKNNIELESAIAAAAIAKETAEDANRTKSLFLANMSHELRTPLNAILGYSEMLQEEAEDQELPEFLPDLKEIHVAGKHLLSLINDILDLSKIEDGKMELYLESFSVPNLIDEVVKTIRPLVEANGNTLRVSCPPDVGVMHADITKMRQSLFNLLSNAAKFTHEGAISLEVSREMMEERDWISFRVSDTGIGMTPEHLIKLFQTFSQADTSTTRKFGGSGLGLALTRRFCQLMGGDVTVNSVPGESSAFTIKVPAVVGELEAAETAATLPTKAVLDVSEVIHAGEGVLPLLGCTILVIDDDATQRNLMRRFLEGEGFAVETASSGEEGLSMARRLLPVAITLDVMMPGMDGWTVLSTLKADPSVRNIPVVMLTMVDDKKRGFALGASNYMTKPVDRRHLAQILKKYSCPHPPCPVLVVEDDATTRNMMRSMLEKSGWCVTEAENGRVALERVAENRPALILLDLMMPEMDGFEFASELNRHEEWRSIPIVVLTAKDLTRAELQSLDGSVHVIVDKAGSSREDLMHQVRGLLDDWAVATERNGVVESCVVDKKVADKEAQVIAHD